MKKRTAALLTIAAFLFLITGILPAPIDYSSRNWSFLFFNLLCSVPSCIILFLMHKKEFFESVGLKRNLLAGCVYGFICALPMLLFAISCGEWNRTASPIYLFNATVVAGFFEEFFFRGLLLGQLFRYAKWGFLPASPSPPRRTIEAP